MRVYFLALNMIQYIVFPNSAYIPCSHSAGSQCPWTFCSPTLHTFPVHIQLGVSVPGHFVPQLCIHSLFTFSWESVSLDILFPNFAYIPCSHSAGSQCPWTFCSPTLHTFPVHIQLGVSVLGHFVPQLCIHSLFTFS